MVKWIYCSALLNIIHGWLEVKLFWQNYYIFKEDGEVWIHDAQWNIFNISCQSIITSIKNITCPLLHDNANVFFYKLFIS